MSLYDDIGIESSTSVQVKEENLEKKADDFPTPNSAQKPQNVTVSAVSAVNKMNLSFLKSQLEAKKAILQNAAAAASQNKSAPGVAFAQPLPATLPNMPQLLNKKGGTFKLKPHKAIPLPIDSTGAFTLVPKSLKEDKVFLFGELMVEDEYNPTAPTDYSSFKQKREQQRLKEKIAKEIADRLAKEAADEEDKRRKGAAIAPPSNFEAFEGAEGTAVVEQVVTVEQQRQHFEQPKLTQFGKGVSRGLGVAANIMSKMGYRQGAGLGAKEQGISRPLEVQRTGKNIGLIFGEEGASTVVTSLEELVPEQQHQPNG
ncbi:hypothetical protein niasHS_005734 [Heterodera schachtii]|uniref:G-patch domain-containing protein n=1 Tax=Heterodera schachtii TaxID=97005 RepID=A0ABD2JZB0_HETSC